MKRHKKLIGSIAVLVMAIVVVVVVPVSANASTTYASICPHKYSEGDDTED